jgi:hypothetical protein
MRLHLLLAALVVLLASNTLAGKPLPYDVSFVAIAGQSDAVLLVERASPFEKHTPNEEGCDEVRWRLVVKGAPLSRLGKPLAVGSTIEVVANLQALFDCHLRKVSPNGGAFSAPQYTAPGPTPPEKGPFLVFVRDAPVGFVLTSGNAWDVASRASELKPPR